METNQRLQNSTRETCFPNYKTNQLIHPSKTITHALTNSVVLK